MTSEPFLLQANGASRSSAAGFPVRTSATPASEPGSKEAEADFGLSSRESLASYDPVTSSWRTSQLCLDGDLDEFSETFPRSGMTRNGRLFRRPTWVRRIGARESGLLPTPSASGFTSNIGGSQGRVGKERF